MARASSVEACLICGNLPCTCFSAKKAARPRKAQPGPAPAPESESVVEEEQPIPVQRKSMLDRMRAKAAAATPVPTEKKIARPSAPPPEPEPEPDLIAAVRLLNDAFEIAEEDLKPFRKYLDIQPTVRERAARWRQSRARP